MSTTATISPQSLGLRDRRQLDWAAHIVAEVQRHRFTTTDQAQRAADITLAAALTESGLWMYANKFNLRSLQLPHDRVGEDHGSVGLLQQQVGGAVHSTADWGSTDQCMNVGYSVRAFLTGVPGHHLGLLGYRWLELSNWAAAQKVQGSFDPTGGNYRTNDSQAIRLRTALWNVTPGSHPAPAQQHPVVGTHRVQGGDTLIKIAELYHREHPWVTADSIAKKNHLADPNLIFIGKTLVIA